MPTGPASQTPQTPNIVGPTYIFAVYSILIYVMGTLIRYNLNKNIVVALVQSALFEATYIALLLVVTAVLRRLRPAVSVVSTVAIILISVPLAALYALVLIPHLLLPLLSALIPAQSIPVYPSGTVLLYYTMISVIWHLSFLWIMAIQRSVESEIAAINARNTFEQNAMLAELRRLRQQLDPHFIFNSLNTIIGEVYESPRDAAALLRELSSYLRYTLDKGEQEFAPVAAEIGGTESFLRVQAKRFGSKLETAVDLDPDARPILIPTLLLQPVVENALKHGLPDASGRLAVKIAIHLEDETLTISVANSGLWSPGGKNDRSTYVGLANLRARIQMHYGERGSFDIRQVEDDVVATIRLTGEPR